MIFTSSSPISPEVEITVFGVVFDYLGIKRLTLELGENKHDSMRLLVSGIPPMRITEYLSAPIQVKWSHNNLSYEFVGYITYIEPEHNVEQGLVKGSPFQLTTIYCLGSSFDMKQKRNNVWNNITLSAVLSQITARYRYSFACPKDDFVFARLVQSGESDWEFLTRICGQLGLSVTLHGTHIHVFDRYNALSRRTSYTELTIPGRTSGRLQSGQVITMGGTFGYVTPDSNVNQEVLSVLDNRGKVFTLASGEQGSKMGKNLPSQFTDELASTSLSSSYAQKKLKKRSRDKFPFKATIEATGITGVLPGGVVSLEDFKSEFDGFWYVTDVTQTLARDKYITELVVIKDSFDGGARRTGTSRARKPPRSVLRSNKWQSYTQQGTQYD